MGIATFLWMSVASSCAQPNLEKRKPWASPPPSPITKDAGFVPDEGDDEDDEGDGDALDDDEAEGDGDGDTSEDSDASTDPEADAAVPPRDAGPIGGCTQTSCGTSCVDLNTSSDHCGACDHGCPGDADCTAGVCGSPDNDCTYQLRDGHDYLFCTDQQTWVDARARCKEFGLDLAIVGDAAENDFLKGSAPRWIGLTNDDDDPFHWIVPGGNENGAAVSFTSWADKEPNNDEQCLIPIPGFPLVCTREDCGELLATGKWNDAYCDKNDTKRGYACESY